MKPRTWARLIRQRPDGRWETKRRNHVSCRGYPADIVILEGSAPPVERHPEVRSFVQCLQGSKLAGLYCAEGPLDPVTLKLYSSPRAASTAAVAE